MPSPADNAATVTLELARGAVFMKNHGVSPNNAGYAALDALLAQAETAAYAQEVIRTGGLLREQIEAERDAAVRAAEQAEEKALTNAVLIAGLKARAEKAERYADQFERAAEQAQERITELHAKLERTNESFLATERSAEQAQAALRAAKHELGHVTQTPAEAAAKALAIARAALTGEGTA